MSRQCRPQPDAHEPELAIIIVSYNSLEDLPGCLDSLPAATTRQTHVVVIDNASTDGTLARLSPRYPGVTWIASEENLGFGPANNLAAARTRSPLVLFLNPDTVVPPGAIDALCGALEALPEAGCVAPKLLNSDGTYQRAAGGPFPSLPAAFLEFSSLRRLMPNRRWAQGLIVSESVTRTTEVDWVAGTCLLARRAAFERSGGFAPLQFLYYEDMDLCRRVREAGFRVYYVPEVRITHLRGKSLGQISPEALRLARASIRRFLRDRHGPLWWLAFRLIVVAGCIARAAIHPLLAPNAAGRRDAVRRWIRTAQLYL